MNSRVNDQQSKGTPIFKFSENQNIWQITKEMVNKYYYVNKTGNIYFAINDIYLSDEIINEYSPGNSLGKRAEALFYTENGKTYAVNDDFQQVATHFSQIRNCWFNDNVGEVLVCIEIVRGKGGIMGWFNYITILLIRVLDRYSLYFIGTILLSLILFIFVKNKRSKYKTSQHES